MMRNGYTEPSILVENEDSLGAKRNLVAFVALIIVMIVGAMCAAELSALPPTFNGDVDVAALYENPEAYDLSGADGSAHVIVSKNLAETSAKNVCFSVVFNFRGYDTMGESFILIAALSGSLCILRTPRKLKKKKAKKEAA
ncbi:MAG: hypothetical protein J6M47_01685 [Clostridia bacterium]|nr:hypothetical protein [Clostridia bacterium]